MNYRNIADALIHYDPFLSRDSLKVGSVTDLKSGLWYLIKTMQLSLPKISNELQSEAVFIDLVTIHFLSDEQCRAIGRIPIKLSYQHLSAIFMKIHHNAHPAWRYQSQIILSIHKLFSCTKDSYLKTLYRVYTNIYFYVSSCDKNYDRKEIEQFLSAAISILCYYISILEKGGHNSMRIRKKMERIWNGSNYYKLQRLLVYAADLIETNSNDPSSIFALIKILTDKITLYGVMNLLTMEQNSKYPHLDSFFMKVNPALSPKYNISHEVYQAFYKNSKMIITTIDLAKDPIMVFPWKHDRFVQCMSVIGSPNKPWREDIINHAATVYLPIGVTFVHNGMHSTFTGMAKREGKLSISPENECSQHGVIDISELYNLLQFDGTNYLIAGSDVIAGTASCFEFGCIFEIGRMLHEKGICFKNLIT